MIVKIAGICILGSVACIFFRQSGRSEFAVLTALAIGVYVLFVSFSEVSVVMETLRNLAEKTGLDTGIYKTVMKITAVACITQSASELCRDAGEGSLSGKVELFGKIIICAAAIPAVTALFGIIADLL
ncbi:MAG: hypothetical protein IJD97_03250 [Clostridia bacterium]|nr:hypothetical protein [Clostridia bacterium]